jgi:hypothetical protein
MYIHRVELMPAAVKLARNPARETPIVPSDGPPADRLLQSIPLTPELHAAILESPS